jgi:hypothetical protein
MARAVKYATKKPVGFSPKWGRKPTGFVLFGVK